MEFTKIVDDGVCNIVMSGKFTFADHIGLKELLEKFDDNAVKTIQFDMKKVEFVDSAALGLLLLSLDHSKKTGKSMVILEPEGQVKKMFEISRFYELFDIR